jgi:hypothetical protein
MSNIATKHSGKLQSESGESRKNEQLLLVQIFRVTDGAMKLANNIVLRSTRAGTMP